MGQFGFVLGREGIGFLGYIRIDRNMAILEIALRSYLDDIDFVCCTRLGYDQGSRLCLSVFVCPFGAPCRFHVK